MFENVCTAVKQTLEETFDVPFTVSRQGSESFLVTPYNEALELFQVLITYRQTRIIVEITPQKYGVAMLEDIRFSSQQQRNNFRSYIRYFTRIRAKIRVTINSYEINPENIDWDTNITQFNIRITKIPVSDDMDLFDMKKEISEWAVQACGLMMSLLNIEKLETEKGTYAEGGVSKVIINKYERNPVNRELCLKYNGYVCKICGFDFEKMYGGLGYHFIHVHHIVPVSEIKEEYLLNPETDLIPVCANCHAMLHRKNPTLLPEELKEIIYKENSDKEV